MVESKKKMRLDVALTRRKLVASRSQAEGWIKLGKVTINGVLAKKSSQFVDTKDILAVLADTQYVSRAGLKLASVAESLKLDFRNKVILDVGSSTGGFTDFALQHGAKKVYAVDVGTNQLHPKLRGDKRVELHEKTDIREFSPTNEVPKIVLIDVSFISLREILPSIAKIINHIPHSQSLNSQVVVMVKPQFEVGHVDMSHAKQGRSTGKTNPSTSSGLFNNQRLLNSGIIKNDAIRRKILRNFEDWSRNYFVIVDKRDSDVAGAKGNKERFYLLKPIK